MAPLVRTGGSRHTGLAALPHRNIQKGTEKSASNIDVGIITGALLVYTTPCFEALTNNRMAKTSKDSN